jgi:acyl carrier protein
MISLFTILDLTGRQCCDFFCKIATAALWSVGAAWLANCSSEGANGRKMCYIGRSSHWAGWPVRPKHGPAAEIARWVLIGVVRLDVQQDVIAILTEVLGADAPYPTLCRDSALLGAIPGLDSMSVLSIILRLEEHFSVSIADDIDSSAFSTVGALADFMAENVRRAGPG